MSAMYIQVHARAHEPGERIPGPCGSIVVGCFIVGKEDLLITTANDPVLPLDESSRSHRHVGEFECLDDGLGLVRPNMGVAIVKSGENLTVSTTDVV